MRTVLLFILSAAACYGQFDDRLKSMPRADVPTVDINRMFSAYEWQIRISDPAVKRIDLKFSFQDEVVVETWLIDEQTDPERTLDIAIGPLSEIDLGKKWRVYAGIRGRSSWWNRTISIPEAVVGRKSSMAGGPVLQDDGTFGLIFFEIPTDEGVKQVPLKVRVTLSKTKEKAEPGSGLNDPSADASGS